MFRIRKSVGEGADAGIEAEAPSAVLAAPPPPEAPEPKLTPARRTAPPIRPLPSSPTPLDLTRRPGEVVGAAARSESASPARDKTLVVGKDVEFSGDIKACQKLIVEGTVEVNSSDCRLLHIGATGVFRGRIEVAEAEILGYFDGELVARERLIVRASGHASGKIQYGTIVIDAGGQVAGEISAIDRNGPRTAVTDSDADILTIPGAAAVGGSSSGHS